MNFTNKLQPIFLHQLVQSQKSIYNVCSQGIDIS